MRYKADFIQLFPKKWMKHKKSLARLMKQVSKKRADIGIIYGFGDHHNKELKGQATYYICFSNDASKLEELQFYAKGVPQEINKMVYDGLKKLNLIK